MAVLRALATEKSESHRRRFVGQELEAITLHTPSEVEARGRTAALSENFLPMEFDARLGANRLLRVWVMALDCELTLQGSVVQAAAAVSGSGMSV